jgi:HNH endonuclease
MEQKANVHVNVNEWEDVVPGVSALTTAELDRKLEEATVVHQKAESLICCFLTEVQTRRAYRELGFSSIADYARERFGFQERKTRYLVYLGRKVKELPQLRAALASGKLGWVKATRIAAVASREDEAMWVDSALSLTMQELDRRIKDGTDRMASMLHFWVSDDLRVLWENGLELARKAAGAELSPTEAFELMVAEFIATYSEGEPDATRDEREEDEACSQPTPPEDAQDAPVAEPASVAIDTCDAELDRAGSFGSNAPFDRKFKKVVLDRDQWKCTYPGCSARQALHVHHVTFRSRGGPNEPWNCTTLCAFHHGLAHVAQIGVEGRAPHALEWTPPKLMKEVLERMRNRRPFWPNELEIRDFPASATMNTAAEEVLVST